jgi:hypothetical protein
MDWSGLISWFGEHYALVLSISGVLIAASVGFVLALRAWRRLEARHLPSRLETLQLERRELEKRRRELSREKARLRPSIKNDIDIPLECRTIDAPDERELRGGTSLFAFKSDPSSRALQIEAGRLVYQIPKRMWRGVPEKVEVRLGRVEAQALMQGFVGRGDLRIEGMPIVETMSVTLVSEPGTFDIVSQSERDQLVKPDLVRAPCCNYTTSADGYGRSRRSSEGSIRSTSRYRPR